MDFLIVADVFSKYIIVRKLPNCTSTAVCIELLMIVKELGLPHIISGNGQCYNSKEFQQFLQCYTITHQASSPNHPRSNEFVERMVGVAKKLRTKLEKKENHGFQVHLTTELHHSQAALHHHFNYRHSTHPGRKTYLNSPNARCPEIYQTHKEARE